MKDENEPFQNAPPASNCAPRTFPSKEEAVVDTAVDFGGKVEENETPEEAIIRELKEEINIDVSAACLAPLSFTEKNYEKYYVVVLLYVCRKWEGFMKPMENQELAWTFPNDIADYKVLPADKSFFATLRDLI